MIDINLLSKKYGEQTVLDIDLLSIPSGQTFGLVGNNGAGKTTLFNCLSRLYIPNQGDIRFQGKTILNSPPHQMAEIGIGRTFQNLALFKTMTVLDNIMVGGHARSRSDFVSNAFRLPWVSREENNLREAAWELIDYLELNDVAYQQVGGLPFGTQKRVEMGRALAAEPTLLLLDEPAGGLNHDEVNELGDLIKQVRDDRDITVLLVEHHMSLVMSVSDQIVAIDFGRKIGEGTPEEIQQNQNVINAYLGTPE